MRSPALVLALCLHGPASLACHPELAPVSTTPTPAAARHPSPAPAAVTALDLNLPAIEPDPAIVLAAVGDGPPPTAHRLPDGRVLIHDGYRDRVAIRDPRTGRDTDLGEVTRVDVPRLGWLIVPKTDGSPHYHDVDPAAPRLRSLWRSADADPALFTRATLAGLDRGAPLFVVRYVGQGAGQEMLSQRGTQLVRVLGPGRVEARPVPLAFDVDAPSADAVRDHRLLLVDTGPPRRAGLATGQAFTAAAQVLDLGDLTVRELGEARGAWTDATAMPHPYLALRWSDHDRHARDHGWAEGCINIVDVAHEQLTPCAPR